MTSLTAGPGMEGARTRTVLGWLAALVAASWLVLLGWGRSGAAGYLDHDGLAHPDLLRIGLLALGWLLMTVAMMVPASLPFVARLVGRSSLRPAAPRVGGLLAGFAVVWLAFGVVVTMGDIGVHRLVASSAWLTGHAWLVFPVTLALAGGYQLSTVKRHALEMCTEPMPALSARWEVRGAAAPVLAGLRHGVDCVGSCGGIMLVVFALGMSNLVGMLAGTAIAVVERRLGVRAVVAVAFVLVVAAFVARVSG